MKCLGATTSNVLCVAPVPCTIIEEHVEEQCRLFIPHLNKNFQKKDSHKAWLINEKRCKEKELNISKMGIYCALNGKGKSREVKSRAKLRLKSSSPHPVALSWYLRKWRPCLTIGENPATQRAIAWNVGTSYTTEKRSISLYCADTAKVWIHQEKLHLPSCCCIHAENGTEDPYRGNNTLHRHSYQVIRSRRKGFLRLLDYWGGPLQTAVSAHYMVFMKFF